ncbi:MAG: hypothetical protein ABI678_31500, partial [Kofleriaceae bacterium]
DLSSVRYERSGGGHHYLSTAYNTPVGDREVSISVYLLADRYVAEYSESKRKSASESEVLVQQEITGSVSGGTLGNLGSLRLVNETKNGKPVVELSFGQQVGVSPKGLTMRLQWVYGSWAPKSVQ